MDPNLRPYSTGVSEPIVSGVQIVDDPGKQISVIRCSDSSAVVNCKVTQFDRCVTSLLDTGSQVSLVRSCLLPSDVSI